MLHASAAALSRGRPVWMVSFAVGEASLSEGLRAACASTAMLAVGNLLHEPEFAWAAIGAFWTCLADAAGSNRSRFASMTSFALLSALCGGLTAFASGVGTVAAALAVLAFTTAGALGRIWGAAAAQVAILAATACVVMVDRPMHDLRTGAAFLAIYLSGCLFAIVLSLTVWRIHPFAPSRTAVRSVYGRLADIALDSARLLGEPQQGLRQWELHAAKFRGDARAALERARKALASVPVSRADQRDAYANLLIALADGERLFAYLIAVSGACQRGRDGLRDARRAARVLVGLAARLRRTGSAVYDAPWVRPVEQQRRIERLARQLDAALDGEIAWPADQAPIDPVPPPSVAAGWIPSLGRVLTRAAATFNANLLWQSIGLRHAARVGVATTAGFLIVRLLGVPFGYWATMAILLILQPSIAGTWPRSLERAAGSVVGGLLAAAIGFAIHSPLGISLVVFPLVCATMALRPVSYSLFVLFLTPTFVLVADFATPGAREFVYAATRLGNNVLGCALALLATFLLWPTREQIDIRARIADAVRANLRYLADALAPSVRVDGDAQQLRRAAGLASNNAEEAFNRLRLERLDDSRFDTAASTILGLLRRMAGTAAHLRLSAQGQRRGAELIAWLAATSRDIEASLRDGDGDASARHTLPPRERLSRPEIEAVGQIALLQRLLADLRQAEVSDDAGGRRIRQPG
nr:FUSC family protein [Burkholderia alba]